MAKSIKRLDKEFTEIQKTLRALSNKAKGHFALLPDNLTKGALDGKMEKGFCRVDLSKLLHYIADLM